MISSSVFYGGAVNKQKRSYKSYLTENCTCTATIQAVMINIVINNVNNNSSNNVFLAMVQERHYMKHTTISSLLC